MENFIPRPPHQIIGRNPEGTAAALGTETPVKMEIV